MMPTTSRIFTSCHLYEISMLLPFDFAFCRMHEIQAYEHLLYVHNMKCVVLCYKHSSLVSMCSEWAQG